MLSIPALCWLCRLPLRLAQHGLCSSCLRLLPALPELCPCCGLAARADQPCGRCLQRPPPWQYLICVSDYQPPLSHWVQQLKFSRATALRVMLARLLLLKWLAMRRRYALPYPDIILSVPCTRAVTGSVATIRRRCWHNLWHTGWAAIMWMAYAGYAKRRYSMY